MTGKLTAEVNGPNGRPVPCDLDQHGDGRYMLSFVPQYEGSPFVGNLHFYAGFSGPFVKPHLNIY